MIGDVLAALTRRRWLSLPIIAVATTLLSLSGLNTLPHAQGNLNEWDVFLGVWDTPLAVAAILPITFFSLTVDLMTPTFADHSGYYSLGRYASRWRWWIRKVAVLGLLTLVFVSVFWLIVLIVSRVGVPWAWTWSRVAIGYRMHYPGGLSPVQLTQPPPLVMGIATLLVGVGLYAWSLCVLVVGWITTKPIWGWVTGAVLAMLSYGLWMVHPAGLSWSWAPLLQLLLSVHQGYSVAVSRGLPVWGALLMDVVVMAGSIVIGFAVLRRRIL